MRSLGVRSLAVSCMLCHHGAVLSVEPWPDHIPVPTFGPRMVCTRCGILGADARPNVSLLQCSTPLPRWAKPDSCTAAKAPLLITSLVSVIAPDCYTNMCCVSYFTLLSRQSCYRAQGDSRIIEVLIFTMGR